MAIKHTTTITTDDTGKTYEIPLPKGVQLWEAQLSIRFVGDNGHGLGSFRQKASIHLERRTLEDAGLVPMARDREESKEQPTETAEELLVRLLEKVGVFPTE